jgi:formylglycine-generating enzyme required for sulfatase activity
MYPRQISRIVFNWFVVVLCAVPPEPTFAQTEESVDGVVFVHIPGGCFNMGSPPDERWRDGNEDLHPVCVAPFALAKFETSNAEFRRFRPGHHSTDPLSNGPQPAGEVTWHAAIAYTQWLSQRTGRKIRLPTEAEWEYAARGGTQTPTPWGEMAKDAGRSVCDGCGTRWDAEVTAPVDSLPPNPFGLFNMIGNVWEWTCSIYEYLYRGAEQVCSYDLTNTERVRRGGGYADSHQTNRSAYRARAPLNYFNQSVGFRLLLENQPPAAR